MRCFRLKVQDFPDGEGERQSHLDPSIGNEVTSWFTNYFISTFFVFFLPRAVGHVITKTVAIIVECSFVLNVEKLMSCSELNSNASYPWGVLVLVIF